MERIRSGSTRSRKSSTCCGARPTCPSGFGANPEAFERRIGGQALQQILAAFQAVRPNHLMQVLAIAAGFDAAHQQPLRREKRHRVRHVLGDRRLPHLETGRDVGGEDENRVGREESFGEHQTPIGTVVQRALEPLLRGRMPGVAFELDDEPRQPGHSLRAHRIALVWHRGRAHLIVLERLQQFLFVLQQPEIGREFGG